MKNVKDILADKGDRVIYAVGPDDTVFEAVTRMATENVGAMLVTVEGRLAGIVTERDYLRFITVKGRTARDTPVKEIMTRQVIFLTPDATVDEAMSIMTEKRLRHLPVMDGDEILGVVSIGDLVKQQAKLREVRIRTLEEFIFDPYPGPTDADVTPTESRKPTK